MNVSMDYCKEYLTDPKTVIVGILALSLILYGIVVIIRLLCKRYLINWSQRKEYWLPVVDDAGNVIGRVARSVSIENPKAYQHPLIRVMVYKPGMIYLSPRRSEIFPDHEKYDHAFERMMRYGENVEECVRIFKKRHFPKSKKPHFALKYKHKNEIGTWQVLLYILKVDDESELINMDKNKGKFWPLSQIKENKGKGCFSALLEGELDFINMIIETIK